MFRSTTIISVRRGGRVVLAGDGQVTMSERVVIKHSACKIRKLHDGQVLCGFAGAAADGLTLCEVLEGELRSHNGSLLRAAVEMAKAWRTQRTLQKLEAMMIAADAHHTLLISGTGDVIEPEGGVIAIGSGGHFALSAARALIAHTQMDAEEVVRASMDIAAQMCVYTNDQLTLESLPSIGDA